MTDLALLPSSTTNVGPTESSPVRPLHRIHRKPPAFDVSLDSPLQKLASLPSAPSAILHLNLLRSESPRCPSSPELPSSPCTSDFRSSDGEDSTFDDDEYDDEDHFRLGMPRLHSSLGYAANSNINFARPFPQVNGHNTNTNVATLDSEDEDKGDDESGPGGEQVGASRLLNPEAVQHLFGKSMQRTRRMTSSRDLASILDGTVPAPAALDEVPPPVPAIPASYSPSRAVSSVRSEHSSTSSTFTTFNNPRRVASRSAYKDELAEMADQAAFPTKPRMSKQKTPVVSDDESEAKPSRPASVRKMQPELEERRQGMDFGEALSDFLDEKPRGSRSNDFGPVVVNDDDDEEMESVVEDDARVVDRLLKGFRQSRKSTHSSPTGPARLLNFSRPASPSPNASRPVSVMSTLSPSPTAPTFPVREHTPASAHALFASIPLPTSTSEAGTLAGLNSLNPPIASPLRSSTSLSSSITSASGPETLATPTNATPTTTIHLVGAYTTRKRAPPSQPSLGLKELRELRTAAVVLEQDARKHVRTAFPTGQMEKRLKRKPVPVSAAAPEIEIELLSDETGTECSGSAPISSASSSSDETFYTPAPTPGEEKMSPLEMDLDGLDGVGEEEILTPKAGVSPVDEGVPAQGRTKAVHTLTVDILPHSTGTAAAAQNGGSLFRRSTLNPLRKETQSPFFPPVVTPARTSSLIGNSAAPSTTIGPKIEPRSSSLFILRPSTLTSRRDRRRSSASSFESCPIPPTPEEASFFPPCPSPQPDEFGLLPSAQSVLFEQVARAAQLAEEAAQQAVRENETAAATAEWAAGSGSANGEEVQGLGLGLGLGLGRTDSGAGGRGGKRQREVSSSSSSRSTSVTGGGGLKRWGEEARRVLSGGVGGRLGQ